MTVAALLAGAERAPGRLVTRVPDTWMQGRSVYGGLQAALGHEVARSAAAALPPLRSMEVAFVGPLTGRIEASATLLRQGRSTAFVRAELAGEAGLGFSATFMFTAARPSTLDHENAPSPSAPDPDTAAVVRMPAERTFFAHNLEYRHATERADRSTPRLLRWVRLVDRIGLDPVTELLTVADALPPAAMAIMPASGPVSSTTWLLNLLRPAPETRDGWWLLRADAEQVRDGFSSQSMAIWSRDRQPVAAGMQSVAVFV